MASHDFIANLNMTAPALLSGQDFMPPEDSLEADLAMFTNTNFFDFDAGQHANLQAPTYERPAEEELKTLDFDLAGDFTFSEYNQFSQTPAGFVGDGISPVPHPIQTDVANRYPSPSTVNSPRSALVSPRTGEKRKPDAQSSVAFEDASRVAAEEDKRRRNTAASARFRIKKKQREQALEQSAKQMSDKMTAMEARIQQLETENKWLKNLITEKNEKEKEKNNDVEALFKKFSKENATKEGSEGKEGVGTTEKFGSKGKYE